MGEQTSDRLSHSSMLVQQLDSLGHKVDDNTKATIAMSAAIKMIYTVPLALVAMGISSWMFWQSRIGEWNWMAMMIVTLTPFFGEGVAKVLNRAPVLGKQIDKAPIVILGTGLLLLLCGCSGGYSQWDRTHERTYGVTYDADSKSGAVSMTIRPASVASTVPAPASGMNDETIAKIVRLIYEEASKKEAAGILDTPNIGGGNVLSMAGGTPALR